MDYSKYKLSDLFFSGTAKKNAISVQKKRYILEFQRTTKDGEKLYNHVSQYIASKIFEMLNIPCISGELGTYHGENVFVYKDLQPDGYTYVPYKDIVEQMIDKDENLALYNIDNIVFTIQFFEGIKDKKIVYDTFFKLMVVDTIIANEGRDMVSWGFFVNDNNEYTLAPIANNSFSLFYNLEDYKIEKISKKPSLPDKYIYNLESIIFLKDSPIPLEEILRHTEYDEFNESIEYVLKKFNLRKINNIIDSIKCISKERKDFLKRVIANRLSLVKEIYEEYYNGKKN